MRLGELLCLTHADWHPGSGGTPFIEVVPRDHPHGQGKGGAGGASTSLMSWSAFTGTTCGN